MSTREDRCGPPRPWGRSTARSLRVLLHAIVCLCVGLAGCGRDDSSDTPQPTTTASEAVEGETSLAPTSPPSSEETTAPATDTETTETVAEEPYIVDCQPGMGPITTYWSDGSVTGYSDHCQSIHDQALQGEVEANTPVCDGTICRYPSGATIPDPNAVPDDRCTNQINYAGDPRSNAEINSIGAQTGQCPEPIS
ncbi:hypothetical protein [Rhodococcus sp. HNM0569]|uniref:hypothetical protein n=1 Tax=Rhodococcus sp. HNM0569 TaxID=2716340 RepID=UPI001F0EFF20|nr:hypothetical protein [Rhodococcus sp. HNM0569]